MFGRPVHILAAATIAAAACLFAASTAFANCYSCGPSVIYQAPVVTYSAPMVYGYTYEAPMAYPAPTQYAPGCGCAAQSPMYVVNQGPAFNAPVVGEAEPIPAYQPGYRRAYPYIGGARWHHRGYGHRVWNGCSTRNAGPADRHFGRRQPASREHPAVPVRQLHHFVVRAFP